MDKKGTIQDFSIPSNLLTKPVAVKVYTPPCYSIAAKYPVLYLLHGQTYLDDQWVRLGMTDAADDLIAAKQIQPLIIVMPEENWSMIDPDTSKYGDALITEVIPWVDKNLSTCELRACRVIGGLSRGGNWAVRLGLSNSQLFAAIGAHSAMLFYGDLNRIGYWSRQVSSVDQLPLIFMDVGKLDQNEADVLKFKAELSRLEVAHEFNEYPGHHDEAYWSAHVEEYLRWYAAVLSQGSTGN